MPEPTDPPMTALADAAFRQAAAQVIRRARQTDTPLIVWDPDQKRVRVISPADVPAPEPLGPGHGD